LQTKHGKGTMENNDGKDEVVIFGLNFTFFTLFDKVLLIFNVWLVEKF
jgi:hypothetical protein